MAGEPFETHPENATQHDDRSLVVAIPLIAVGVVWLLSNLGLIADVSWGLLLRLWPLILIVIGLDLLFGRRWPALSALIGLGTVALVVLLLFFAPQLGLDASAPATLFGLPIITDIDDADIRTERFTEPLEDAESARIDLDLSMGRATIHALDDAGALIDADLTHIGEIDFRVSGDRAKMVQLGQRDAIRFGPLITNASPLTWDIGLTREIPLDLTIDVGSGPADADLRRLRLQSLDLNGGSGPLTLFLPEGATDYRARLDGGSGPITMSVPEGAVLSDLAIEAGSGPLDIAIEAGARLQASLDGGSGPLTVDVPEQAGVRVRVTDDGSGSFRVPADYRQVERGDGDTGLWESPYYTSATQRIELRFDLGSGPVTVR